MIAILASPRDIHARAVAQELAGMGERSCFVDTRELGRGALLSYPLQAAATLTPVEGEPIDMQEIRTVWYRRPHHGEIAAGVLDPEVRHFCRQEWATTFDGLLLNLDARFVNPVLAEFAAVKPRQLQVAREAGLAVPDTLITNDPDTVDAFLEKHGGRVVHKALTAPRNRFLDTKRWTEADRAALPSLVLAPTMFQEQIAGPADVRATVVGDEIFAARIATAEGRAGIDSRLDLDAPHEAHELPDDVAGPLLDLMRTLGLVYGTVDLKISDEGEYVFLEVNPQGQFLYVELLTKLPIVRALSRGAG